MKHRFVDILVCTSCRGNLTLKADKAKRVALPGEFPKGFGCQLYCSRFRHHKPLEQREDCRACYGIDITDGSLRCDACNREYLIVEGIPHMVEDAGKAESLLAQALSATDKTYSLLWADVEAAQKVDSYHYNKMQETIPEKIVRGTMGLEIGCGSGIDTVIMAKASPSTEIVSLDLSEGIFTAARISEGLPNVHLVRASTSYLPFRDGTFDFCYSYGVIHHTPDPEESLHEMQRVSRESGKFFLYLYEDHSENAFKRYAVWATSILRTMTTRMNRRQLYLCATVSSPFIYLFFSVPSKILRSFKKTRCFAESMPFNFGTGPFSLAGDLFDRFSAPIELRFNVGSLRKILSRAGLNDVHFSRIKSTAGHVIWGSKGSVPLL